MATIERALLDDVAQVVRAAGELTLRWFRADDLSVEHKADGTPVTAADREAERFLREQLAARFPDDAVIGEEEPAAAGSSGRTWIIDPIDGTKAFTHGVPLYSNLLALYDDEGCALGVINLPALGRTVYAARGLGCFEDGRPVHVNGVTTLDGACVCTSGLGPWSAAQLAAVRRTGALFRTWGDGFGFALVATGRVEAMVDPKVALWDLGPLPVVIREAGGRYSELDGTEDVTLDAERVASAVATNGHVHDEVLGALREQ